jgi:hypothetical protein
VYTSSGVISGSGKKAKLYKNTHQSTSDRQILQVDQKPTRVAFDVVYVYKDKRSWIKFRKLLAAYGVKDIMPKEGTGDKSGEYYIYAGRYLDLPRAMKRKLYLNKKTFTTHAQIKSTKLFI